MQNRRQKLMLMVTLVMAMPFAIRAQEKSPSHDNSGLVDTVRQLDAEDAAVRQAAATTLGSARELDAHAAVALSVALVDGDQEVRRKIVAALQANPAAAKVVSDGLLRKTTDRSQTEDGRPVWYVASVALGRMGSGLLPTFIERLGDDMPLVARAACMSIAEMGPAAKESVPELMRLLGGEDEDLRHGACHALVGIGPPANQAAPLLIKLLDHENLHTQYWSCRALGSIGVPAALPAVNKLVRLSREAPASVRRNAVMTLGRLGLDVGPQLLPVLTAALEDKVYAVRVAAAEALAQLGPAANDALPALKLAIDRPRFEARVPAAVAVWKISQDTDFVVRVLLEEFQKIDAPWEVAEAFAVLGAAGAPAVPGLIDLLEAKHAETRLFVVAALAELGTVSRPALPALRKRLEDENEDVRAAAQQAIELIAGQPILIPTRDTGTTR